MLPCITSPGMKIYGRSWMASWSAIQLHYLHYLIEGHPPCKIYHENNIQQHPCITLYFTKPHCHSIKDLPLSHFQNKLPKVLPFNVLTGCYWQWHRRHRKNHSRLLRALRIKGRQWRESPQHASLEPPCQCPQCGITFQQWHISGRYSDGHRCHDSVDLI